MLDTRKRILRICAVIVASLLGACSSSQPLTIPPTETSSIGYEIHDAVSLVNDTKSKIDKHTYRNVSIRHYTYDNREIAQSIVDSLTRSITETGGTIRNDVNKRISIRIKYISIGTPTPNSLSFAASCRIKLKIRLGDNKGFYITSTYSEVFPKGEKADQAERVLTGAMHKTGKNILEDPRVRAYLSKTGI